jgi:peptidoglycan/LPS O-acetylase OafA/YrhL
MILLYGGLSDRSRLVRYATLAVMAVFAITVPSQILVFRYLSLFALGAVGFQYRVGLIGKREFLFLTAALLLVTAKAIGIPEAMTAAVVGLIGALANPPSVPFLSTLGLLSYSFYLVHVPIGGRIINLAKRLHYTAPVEMAAVVMAMAASLAAAYLLHRFVERPAQNYSGRFKYGGLKSTSRAKTAPVLVPAE